MMKEYKNGWKAFNKLKDESIFYQALPETEQNLKDNDIDIVYRCPNCLKTHKISYNKFCKYFNLSSDGPKFICPDCEYDMSNNAIKCINSRYKGCYDVMYRIKKEKEFIYVEYINNEIFFNKYNYKTIMTKTYHKVVINTNSGRSYVLPIFSNKEEKIHLKHMVDITYGKLGYLTTNICNNHIFKDLLQVMEKDRPIQKYLDIKETDFDEISFFNHNPKNAYDLILANRFYGIISNTQNKDILKILKKIHYKSARVDNYYEAKNNDSLSRKLSKVKPNDNPLDIFRKYNLPNKKRLKKMTLSNPELIFLYDGLRYIGFKNYDIMCNILEQNKDIVLNLISMIYGKSRQFFKSIIKERGEVFASKLLQDIRNNNDHTYNDMISLYNKIGAKNIQWSKIKGSSIKYIHDIFSDIYNLLKHQNRVIPYTEEELKLEWKNNNYSFVLAKETHDLIKVGSKLHICVGSYDDKAYQKKCDIVFMMENKDVVGCIEINPLTHNLIQAKAVCNNLLQENKAEALKAWVTEKEICTNNCYDYQHIAQNKIEYDNNKIYTKSIHFDHIHLNNIEDD